MVVESIKANLRQGWPYALASMLVYYSLVLVFDFIRDLDVYFTLMGGAIHVLIITAIVLLTPPFLLLTLFLGWMNRLLDGKRFQGLMKMGIIIISGVLALFVSSFIILGLIFASGF